MPRLMLLRHAKAVVHDGRADVERPLAPRARSDMPLVARFMTKRSLIADLSLVSPSARTRQTWELLVAGKNTPPAHRFEPRLYAAPAERLYDLIRETPETTHSLLLVGHNPGLEDLASMLIGSGETDALIRFGGGMPTASLAVIELPGDWTDVAPRTGRLDFFVTPKSLAAAGD